MSVRGQIFKHSTDFSFSETRPLFWILLGPLLIMFTLALATPTFSNLFLSFLAIGGSIFSSRKGRKVFCLTLIVFALSFALIFLFMNPSLSLWQLAWGCSLALGLVVSFLSIEEVKSEANQKNREKEKSLKILQTAKHKALIDKQNLEKEMEELKKDLKTSDEKVEVLSALVEASRVESEKLEKRVESLYLDSIELERELEGVKEKDRIDSQTLNREQKKGVDPSIETKHKEVSEVKEEGKQGVLKALEKNKSEMKKVYEQTLRDYQKITGKFQEKPSLFQKTSIGKGRKKEAALNLEIAEKKKELEKVKSELIGIEREIFMIKKEIQEEQTALR